VLAALKAKPSVAAEAQPALTAAARDGARIERPGRENAPQGPNNRMRLKLSPLPSLAVAGVMDFPFPFPRVVE
jgi:hypothetical protein